MRTLGYISIWATVLFAAFTTSRALLYAFEWCAQAGVLDIAFLDEFRGAMIEFYFSYSDHIASVTYFLNGVWFFCASQRAIHRTSRTIGISPGWGLAYFFIPVVNAWGPFLAIRQLWNLTVRPESPADAPAPGFFWPWWLAWLGALALTERSAQIAATDDWVSAYPDYLANELFTAILLAVAAGYFLRIQLGIIRFQETSNHPS